MRVLHLQGVVQLGGLATPTTRTPVSVDESVAPLPPAAQTDHITIHSHLTTSLPEPEFDNGSFAVPGCRARLPSRPLFLRTNQTSEQVHNLVTHLVLAAEGKTESAQTK